MPKWPKRDSVMMAATVLISLGLILLALWGLPKLSVDVLTGISAICQILLGCMGIIVSVLPEWGKANKAKILAAFIVVTLTGTIAATQQGKKSTADNTVAQTQLSGALATIRSSTQQIERITTNNTALQNQLIASDATIAGLAKQGIDSLIGGESFCYLRIGPASWVPEGHFSVDMVGKGTYPLSQMEAQLVDLDVPSHRSASERFIFKHEFPFRYTGHLKQLGSLAIPKNSTVKRFNVFIKTSNGEYTQLIRLKRSGDSWIAATSVTVNLYSGKSGLALVEVGKGFPMTELVSDSDWVTHGKIKRIKLR